MSHGHLSYNVLAPRSRLYQGPFGRICPDLPPAKVLDAHGQEIKDEATLDAHLRDIADKRMSERPGEEPGDLLDEVPELEAEFSSEIPAGYTYFGQFIDHDITLDLTSLGEKMRDPTGVQNFRSPSLDLDSIYGRGPDGSPHQYARDASTGRTTPKLLLGRNITVDFGAVTGDFRNDLPRSPEGHALIGDHRNDENLIVAQTHLAFMKFHNKVVDDLEGQGISA